MSTLSTYSKLSKIKLPSGTSYALIDLDGRAMLAPKYATGTAYAVNDYVIYNDDLYYITTSITAANNTGWAAISATKATVGSELQTIKTTIANINSFDFTLSTSAATTPAGATLHPATGDPITGTLAASASTTSKIYLVRNSDGTYEEYMTFENSGNYFWEKLGDTDDIESVLSNLGSLAYKDSATVTGTAAAQTFSGTQASISISGNVSGTAVSMTPGAGNKTSIIPFASGGSFTQGSDSFNQGSLPSLGTSVANEELTISFSRGSLPTFTQGTDTFVAATGGTAVDALTSLPTPSVTQGTFSGSTTYTPAGTNGTSSISGTAS